MRTLKPRLTRTAPATWEREPNRPDAAIRGYGSAWRKLRVLIMARDFGLCQCPACQGGRLRVTPAHEVHHIVSKAEARRLGWTDAQIDAPSNLQAVSRECHAVITAREGGKARR